MAYLLLTCFFIGFIAIAAVAYLERTAGSDVASGVLISGLSIHSIVTVCGILSGERQGYTAAALGIISLGWCCLVYGNYRFRVARIKVPPYAPHPPDHCTVRKEYGDRIDYPSPTRDVRREGWRYSVAANFYCEPGESTLWQWAWASGGIFYGYWIGWNEFRLTPVISIIYPKILEKCRINEDTEGALNRSASPISITIANGITIDDNIITIKTQIGAAINSSGGSNITGVVPLKPGEAWMTLQFPDCTDQINWSMGTFIWSCSNKLEGVAQAGQDG